MNIVVEVAAYTTACLVALPLTVLACECLLALLPARNPDLGPRKPCAILIPAHDEEAVLETTLINVAAQMSDGDRLVVVADNCCDQTSQIAERFVAEVVERYDPDRRGKGYALQTGVDYLKQDCNASCPEIVVILDADCTFAEQGLDRLVRATTLRECPVQAQYLMHPSRSANASAQLSAFAFRTKNWVRPRGLDRMKLAVPLTGSGMAFPWDLLRTLDLGTSEIVEDLELGLTLVRRGQGPRYCESSKVESYFPETRDAARTQRTRWEHGYLGQMRRQLVPLFRNGVRGNIHAFAAALDLMVPPLSLLVIVATFAGTTLTAHFWFSRDALPLAIFLVACTLASASLMTTWYRFGRDVISLKQLLSIPAYVGSKLALYLTIPFVGEREWKRTQRTTD